MKNNISEEYAKIMDKVYDEMLFEETVKRLQTANFDDAIPAEEVYRELGMELEDFDDEDLDDIEFE